MNYPRRPGFPGWHFIGLFLPLVAIVGTVVASLGSQRGSGAWFPSPFGLYLRCIDVAAFLGIVCAVASLFCNPQGIWGNDLSRLANLGLSILTLTINVILFICLLPVWWAK